MTTTAVSNNPRSEVTEAPANTGVTIRSLRKRFVDQHDGKEVFAVDDVDLTINEGEFCVLLGPSGCGKTTLLRCIAGLETPSSGKVTIDSLTVFDGQSVSLEPQDRPIGMVFQSYALWPHLDVMENVAFPLRARSKQERPSKQQIADNVQYVLDTMGIGGLAKRKISQLSGGQQQRVALARAVAAGNQVILFDEPLSNIDAKVRETLRRELRSMQRELGFTAIYVTHDQTEAMEMADVVAVLREGKVAQFGSPREIYHRPETRYVAEFIGTTSSIPVEGDVDKHAKVVKTDLGAFRVASGILEEDGTGPFTVVMKAQDWLIGGSTADLGVENQWTGIVESRHFMGSHTEFAVNLGERVVRVWGVDTLDLHTGDEVRVGIAAESARVVIDDVN